MTYRIHRMPLRQLIRYQNATGHRYKHTDSKADPSIAVLTNSEADRILEDLVVIAENRDKRWF